MATQKGLGKGLGALFGDINEQTETPAEGAVSLPLQKIEPNPLQPRKTFDPMNRSPTVTAMSAIIRTCRSALRRLVT